MRLIPIIITPASTYETFLTSMSGINLSGHSIVNGHPPIVLANEMAVQPTFFATLSVAKLMGTPLICYFGHGQTYALEGDRKISAIAPVPMWLISKNWNDSWLKDTIVVSIACNSIIELGQSAIEKGCLAYLGSTKNLYIDVADFNNNRINDFVETFTAIPKYILSNYQKSNSMRDVLSNSLEYYRSIVDNFINLYSKNNIDPELITAMQANRDNYTALYSNKLN